MISGGSRNKESTQQILLIIHKNTLFREFFGYFSHACILVQSTAADCSGMVCSSLSVFGNSIVWLATVIGVSSVSSERGGAPLYGSATDDMELVLKATHRKILIHVLIINSSFLVSSFPFLFSPFLLWVWPGSAARLGHVCVRAGVEYWSREYILQSDFIFAKIPGSLQFTGLVCRQPSLAVGGVWHARLGARDSFTSRFWFPRSVYALNATCIPVYWHAHVRDLQLGTSLWTARTTEATRVSDSAVKIIDEDR